MKQHSLLFFPDKPKDVVMRLLPDFTPIHPNQVLQQGDRVICRSNSFPEVTNWQWKLWAGTQYKIIGETETITLDTVCDGMCMLQVIASNNMGQDNQAIDIYLMGKHSTTVPTVPLTGLLIDIILFSLNSIIKYVEQ